MHKILIIVLFFTHAIAQAQTPPPNGLTAEVVVMVTNMKGVVSPRKEVLFTAAKNGVLVSCRTNDSGKASLRLPVGDTYTIRLKTLTDTAMYSTMEVPALQPGKFYTAPFKVEIEFEPPVLFNLTNVLFDTNKPTLRKESFAALNEVADYMKWSESETYEIAGHTDNVGSAEANQRLSADRATAVKTYLIAKGIKASRITARGYGITQPIADNNTEAGRQINRRTELKILN